MPLTIDAQYVAGFNWTRNPQLRVVEDFSKAFSLGLSLESPQTVTSNGINSTGLPTGSHVPALERQLPELGRLGGTGEQHHHLHG